MPKHHNQKHSKCPYVLSYDSTLPPHHVIISTEKCYISSQAIFLSDSLLKDAINHFTAP